MDFALLVRVPDDNARELAAPVVLASPAAVVEPRSGSRGPACRAAPCTLRGMRAAEQTLN